MSNMENEDIELMKKLSSCGCQFPSGASTLKEVPHNYVLAIAQKCIDIISGESSTPIPKNKGDQVLLASRIAAICIDLGYEGELGYDLFIYPNEQDLRSVLTFLLSKISDDNKKNQYIDANDNISLLMKKISIKFNDELARPWFPPYCIPKGYQVSSDGTWSRDGCCYIEPFHTTPFAIRRDVKNVTQAFTEYWNNIVPCNEDSTNESFSTSKDIAQADEILNELRTKCNFNIEIFASKTKQNDTVEDKKIEDTNESNDCKIDIENLDIETLLNNKQTILKTLFLGDGNEENIKLLESKLTSSINDLKGSIQYYNAKVKNEKIIEKEEIVEDDEYTILEKQTKKKAAKLKKAQRNTIQLSISPDKDRLIHANDVIETIEHLQKLQIEMSKIISNINTTQKDINRINGILDRSFVVADDLIFKDAKKDDFARKTYKLVANVHTECNELCNMVEEIGIFTRDTVAIEKNVETAQKKNTKENLERAMDDLRNLVK